MNTTGKFLSRKQSKTRCLQQQEHARQHSLRWPNPIYRQGWTKSDNMHVQAWSRNRSIKGFGCIIYLIYVTIFCKDVMLSPNYVQSAILRTKYSKHKFCHRVKVLKCLYEERHKQYTSINNILCLKIMVLSG